MEPVAKRSRIGASPFDRKQADDDELHMRPEEVNALRDPGIQLQQSRAFAAFKLKSTFENIFEKFGKDFTGIGDEIDLITGKIVVDNGHLESLEESTINRDDDDDDEVEETAEEEERIFREKARNQLGLLGSDAHLPAQSMLQAPWSESAPFMGGVLPVLSSPMHPGQVRAQFGSFSMPIPHGVSSPSLDPTWRAPDLPPLTPGNGYGSSAPPTRRRAKIMFITEEEDGENVNDILLERSPLAGREIAGNAGVDGLASTPSPAQEPPREAGDVSTQPQPSTTQKVVRVRYKIPEILVRDSLKHQKKKRKRGPNVKASKVPGDSVAGELKGEKGSNKAVAKSKDDTRSKKSTPTSQAATSDKAARPEVDISFSEGKIAEKPSNQTLRVEIRAMAPADISTYMPINPEGSPEPGAVKFAQEGESAEGPPDAMEVDDIADTHPVEDQSRMPEGDIISDVASNQASQEPQAIPLDQAASEITERDKPHRDTTPEGNLDTQPPAKVEVFSRNFQDPSYAFSDEDEPTIPRKQPRRRTCGPKEVAIITHSEAFSKPTTSHNPLPSPATTASKCTTKPNDSFELSTSVTQDHEPQSAEPVEMCLNGQETIETEPSPQQTPPESNEVHTPRAISLLSVKPRRSGIRRSFMNSEDAFITQPILPSVERALETERTVTPDPPVLNNRKRRHSRIISSDGPVSDRVIPETPEPSPGPDSRRRPQQPSPELGMSSPKAVISPIHEDTSPQENLEESLPDVQSPPSPEPFQPPPPQTPSQKALRRLARPTGSSSAKNSILSLVSDDEDELSLDPSDFTPSGSRRPKPNPKPTPATHKSLSRLRDYLSSSGPSSTRSTKSTLTRRGAILGNTTFNSTRTPPSKGRYGAGLVSKLSLSNVSKLAIRSGPTGGGPGSLMRASASGAPPSPASRLGSELIQTPGGSVRRCGEGDFRCDRDFCFVCL